MQDNSTVAGAEASAALTTAHARIAAAYVASDLDGVRAGVAEAAHVRQGPDGLVGAVGNATAENVPGMLSAALGTLARHGRLHREHMHPVDAAAHARGMTADAINAAIRAARGVSLVGGGTNER